MKGECSRKEVVLLKFPVGVCDELTNRNGSKFLGVNYTPRYSLLCNWHILHMAHWDWIPCPGKSNV